MLWATAHQFRKPSSNDPLLRVGEGGGVALSKKNFLTQVVDIVPAGSYNLRMDVSCPVAGTKIRMQINWIDKTMSCSTPRSRFAIAVPNVKR